MPRYNSITKEICITIDFASPPWKKFLEESQAVWDPQIWLTERVICNKLIPGTVRPQQEKKVENDFKAKEQVLQFF